jgi:hypothetical protein
MSETAMKAAFKKAGVKSAEERLREIALKSMIAYADDLYGCVENIFGIVKKSPELMEVLFFPERHRVIGHLLHKVREDVASKDEKRELRTPLQRKGAVVVRDFRKQRQYEEDENRRSMAEYAAEQERQRQVRIAELHARWKATPIGGVQLGGTPVWQLTPGTVRTWLSAEQRRWRCIELLIAGLPDDGRPIEFYRKPEEVAALWKQAAE